MESTKFSLSIIQEMKNILITSAGRRVSLVKEFIETVLQFDDGLKVFTTDLEPDLAPACHFSHGSFKVSPVTSDGYIAELLEICESNDIGIIVPTIDTCLPVLAANKYFFAHHGIQVVVSSEDLVRKSCDKRLTGEVFKAHGIRCPKPIDVAHPEFPLFAKPRNGSSGKGAHTFMAEEDLPESIKKNPDIMFMEYIDKKEYKEFTVDMYYGRDNCVKAIVPRERIEVRGGEVSKSVTHKPFLVEFIKERFVHLHGAAGPVCIQLFYRESDNDVVGIEINPRFGGGYPLTYHAGSNFPRMIIEEYLLDKSLDFTDDWRDNLLMLRYDAEVIL